MGGAEDDWVEAAMVDDSLVAELLMRLHRSEDLHPPSAKSPLEVVPLEWGMRQPRSRPVLRCSSITIQAKKEGGESTRASPTTPLSWSGGTSVSGGAGGAGAGVCGGVDDVAGGSGGGGGGSGGDCYEESSRPVKRPSGVRSKVTGSSEATNRRTRKKKTFAELKEEDCLLSKENNYLKKEVAKFRLICENERARNNVLKRTKLDLQLRSAKQISTSDALKVAHHQPPNSEINQIPPTLPTTGGGVCCEGDDAAAFPTSHPSDTREMPSEAAATQKSSVFLPDLNLPLDEGSGPEDLYGIS